MRLRLDAVTRTLPSLLAFLAAILAASCTITTPLCGCSPAPYGIAVTGVVTGSTGLAAEGAIVRATIFANACPADGRGAVSVPPRYVRSDAAGRFHLFQTSAPVEVACVRVGVYADTLVDSAPLVAIDRPGVRIAFGDSVTVALQVP